MSRFLHSRFSEIAPYVPGEQPCGRPWVKLNTNESPYPPAPGVAKAVAGTTEQLNLYPEITGESVGKPLAAFLGVAENQVFAANGSDEVLAFCFWAFCPDGAAFADITYGFYHVYSRMFEVEPAILPLRKDFSLNPLDYKGVGRTIFIASPNSPTAQALRLEEIENILRWNPGNLVVVDEAYIAFGGQTAIPLLDKYDNLLVVGTFSKARSLAGARLGYAAGSVELIEELKRMKYGFNPYNVNSMTLAAANASLADDVYYQNCVRKIVQTRDNTQEELRALGFVSADSAANFLFVSHPQHSASHLFQRLREEGVLVRWFKQPRIENHLRVSVGSEEQMQVFVKATRRILEE